MILASSIIKGINNEMNTTNIPDKEKSANAAHKPGDSLKFLIFILEYRLTNGSPINEIITAIQI